MPDVTLTPHDLAGTGGKVLVLQTVDLADEYLFLNDGRTLLVVENGTGANALTAALRGLAGRAHTPGQDREPRGEPKAHHRPVQERGLERR